MNGPITGVPKALLAVVELRLIAAERNIVCSLVSAMSQDVATRQQ